MVFFFSPSKYFSCLSSSGHKFCRKMGLDNMWAFFVVVGGFCLFFGLFLFGLGVLFFLVQLCFFVCLWVLYFKSNSSHCSQGISYPEGKISASKPLKIIYNYVADLHGNDSNNLCLFGKSDKASRTEWQTDTSV